MNELWAITVALPHEAQGLRLLWQATSRTRYRQMQIEEGTLADRPALLVTTGMGLAHALNSARFLFGQFPVTHLLSTGYCGALRSGMGNGEALVAERCALETAPGQGWLADLPLIRRADEALKASDLKSHHGLLLSCEKPVLKSAEKEALGQKTGAGGVDMESAAILQAAAESGKKIASVTVRFIVDALGDELTDTGPFLDENAGVKPLSLVREMIRRPKLLKELPDLGRKAGRARASLNRFVSRFFGMA